MHAEHWTSMHDPSQLLGYALIETHLFLWKRKGEGEEGRVGKQEGKEKIKKCRRKKN